MKRYRLGYDYLLLADDVFNYKGENIDSVSVDVLFHITDKFGNEILFESNELEEQSLFTKKGKEFYLSDLINCNYDKEKMINFRINIPLLKESNIGSVYWEIDSYDKGIYKGNGFTEGVIISEDEFMDIMRNNKDRFDNSNNHSAQTTSYFTREVSATLIERR